MSIVERALQKAQAKANSEARPAPEAGALPGTGGSSAEAAAVSATASKALSAAVSPEDTRSGFASEPVDHSLSSRDLKAIVQLDIDRLREEGRLPSLAWAPQTEEEIRRIKWPLLKAIEGSDGVRPARNNVVLVTSALPGEGKTFTALNLALSIVRDRELRVVLVDGDVARPGLTPSLGLEERPGLIDALEDANRDVSTVTYQTDVEGLFFVPAGPYNPHAPEFMAGSRMPLLIEALSRRVGRGVVIFDSPPLLATNEAQVATRFAGQVLLVVRAAETDQAAVLDALALVDKDAPVSAVLNRCQPSVLSRYYGQYYYGYGHGYGSSQGYGKARGHRVGKGDA